MPTAVLHVIIQNTSNVPQKHFDEWNSWGYATLTVDWTDGQGHSGTVSRVARGFGKNASTTTVLQPGESLVREISFDPKFWQGWPGAGRNTLTLKVTYRPKDEPPTKSGAWTGTAVSKEETVMVFWPG